MDATARILEDGEDVVKALSLLVGDLEQSAKDLISAQVAWSTHKAGTLPSIKETLEGAESEAIAEAYVAGAAEGKNQKERDQKMAAWLNQHAEYQVVLGLYNRTEYRLAQLDGERFAAETMYKTTVYKFHAMQSVADIVASRLRVLANTKGERS